MAFGRGRFGRGAGRGRGNPYPFCRFYPWLPRRWWLAPYASQYPVATPYIGYRYPGYGAYMPYPGW